MPNLSNLEINEVRPFFVLAHSRLAVLDPDAETQGQWEELWLEKPQEAKGRAERRADERRMEVDEEEQGGGGYEEEEGQLQYYD